ncbi:hypothetical protein FRC12_005253 [Ceratobasidium sp. 428]|nr:hypothetical protein FRC12_005253 [Ceratobasidium sp. 428]
MSTTKPRLSKRESSSALRQDAVAPSGGKKRTSSIASNASRVSMFANPTKHFGLARKASTATLSAAPVSVSVGGIDHGLEVPSSKATISGSSAKGNGADKLRPVRQATRAEDALRSVQSRTPQAPVPPSEPELAPLSESPSAAPIPLPGIKDALDTPMLSSSPNGTENITALSSTPPKPKPTTPSRIPRLRGQSSSPSITNKDVTATNISTSPAPSTPPVSSSPGAQPKFRTPSLTPEFGASRLARKSSTSSIRSYDPTNNNKQPVSPSPLSQHSSTPTNAPTLTLSAPPPTPASLPVPGTGSSSSPNPTSTNASTQGSSWLAAIRSVGRSNASSSAPSTVSAPAELKSDMNGTALSMNKPSDDSAATLTLSTPQSTTTQSNVETSQAAAHNESDELAAPIVTPSTVVVVAPTSTIESLAGDDAHTLTINTLAAQHGARIGTSSGYSPAGWLAWLTSTPSSHSGSPTLIGTGRLQIKDDTDDMVMYIDSDDEGTTPGGDATTKDNGKGKAKAEGTVKRPGMGEIALSVDSVVPALSEGEGDSGEYLIPFCFVSSFPWYFDLAWPLDILFSGSTLDFPRALDIHLGLSFGRF